jgi:phytoene dehydrogenase-like protein
MEPSLAQTDVVVIGGGISGLSAACYLAREGVGVTLLERSPNLGGRASSQDLDGFTFNRGIHALYTGGATSQVLEELGVTYSYGIPDKLFMLESGELRLFPSGLSQLLRTDLLSPGDKLGLVRFFATLAMTKPRSVTYMSVQEWLERNVRRPHLRRMIAAGARTFVYSAALDVVSAEVFVDKMQRSNKHPIHYIEGGWQYLVEALRQKAERGGVRVMLATRAEATEHEGGRARGVRLRDGRLLPASAVIVATTPREAAKLVDGGAYPALRRAVDRLIPGRVASLDVALGRLPSPQQPVVQDLEGSRFMTVQSVYARVAPEEGAMISAFKQLDPRCPTDPREDERELEDLLDAAQPGWRSEVLRRQYLPRIEAVSALPTAAEGSFAGRPGTRVPGISNLYLAGDWVGPEGFLADASTASAREAARLVLEDGSLSRQRRLPLRKSSVHGDVPAPGLGNAVA